MSASPYICADIYDQTKTSAVLQNGFDRLICGDSLSTFTRRELNGMIVDRKRRSYAATHSSLLQSRSALVLFRSAIDPSRVTIVHEINNLSDCYDEPYSGEKKPQQKYRRDHVLGQTPIQHEFNGNFASHVAAASGKQSTGNQSTCHYTVSRLGDLRFLSRISRKPQLMVSKEEGGRRKLVSL
jgi:hypothetical protein